MAITRRRPKKTETPKVVSHREDRHRGLIYLVKWKNGIIEESDESAADSESIEEYWNTRTEKTQKRLEGQARKSEIAKERRRLRKLEKLERERLADLAQEEQEMNRPVTSEVMEVEEEPCSPSLPDDCAVADIPSEHQQAKSPPGLSEDGADDVAVVPGKQHNQKKTTCENQENVSRPPIVLRIPREQIHQKKNEFSDETDDSVEHNNNTNKMIAIKPELPVCAQLPTDCPVPDVTSKTYLLKPPKNKWIHRWITHNGQ